MLDNGAHGVGDRFQPGLRVQGERSFEGRRLSLTVGGSNLKLERKSQSFEFRFNGGLLGQARKTCMPTIP